MIQNLRYIMVFVLAAVITIGNLQSAVADDNEIQSVNVEGTSKADNESDAVKEITAWAIATSAREQVIELIGDQKYQKNKATVETKVIKQASKFIPVVNPSPIAKQPDGSWKMSVELRYSPASLREVVLNAGLLNDAEGPATVLPMIAFVDRVKAHAVRWWVNSDKEMVAQGLMASLSHSFNEKLQIDLTKAGFHSVKPADLTSKSLSNDLRTEHPSNTEMQSIADLFKATLVARGDVRFQDAHNVPGAYECSVKITVQNLQTGRLIAEVTRTFNTEPGLFDTVAKAKFTTEMPEIVEDLVAQIQESWLRGTVNASVYRLAAHAQLNPKQEADFRAALIRSVKEIKGLSARAFERGQVEYEVDFNGTAQAFGEKLKSATLTGFDVKFRSQGKEQGMDIVVLDVKAH